MPGPWEKYAQRSSPLPSPPQAPKEEARQLSKEEAEERGLPTSGGQMYQVMPNKAIDAIEGTTSKAGRSIPVSLENKLTEQMDIFNALDRAVSNWNDGYSGNALTGGMETVIQRMFGGIGTPGQAEWWSDFRSTDNLIRNQMFGSALTETEKKAYEATTISERTDPKVARERLAKRRAIIQQALRRRARTMAANGYNPDAISAVFGDDPALIDALDKPAKPAASEPAPKPSSPDVEAILRKHKVLKAP